MNSQFNTKIVNVFAPVSLTAGATASGSFDTKGFGNCQLLFLTTTTHKPTSILVDHSDASGSGYSSCIATNAITYVDGTASVQQAMAAISIPLVGKKRYLKVTYNCGTAQLVDCVAMLGEPAVGISTAATKNAGNFLEVP